MSVARSRLTAGKWGPEFYNGKKLDSANNLSEPGAPDPEPPIRLCETWNREEYIHDLEIGKHFLNKYKKLNGKRIVDKFDLINIKEFYFLKHTIKK